MKKEYTQRHPIVNGLFYPDSKEELENTIQGYIERVDKDKVLKDVNEQTGLTGTGKRTPLVLIAPHAGYIFSGRVQAYSKFAMVPSPRLARTYIQSSLFHFLLILTILWA